VSSTWGTPSSTNETAPPWIVIITEQEHPTARVPWLNLRDRLGVVAARSERRG
jgi:selenocysteine lyase/cysteine desulfurase